MTTIQASTTQVTPVKVEKKFFLHKNIAKESLVKDYDSYNILNINDNAVKEVILFGKQTKNDEYYLINLSSYRVLKLSAFGMGYSYKRPRILETLFNVDENNYNRFRELLKGIINAVTILPLNQFLVFIKADCKKLPLHVQQFIYFIYNILYFIKNFGSGSVDLLLNTIWSIINPIQKFKDESIGLLLNDAWDIIAGSTLGDYIYSIFSSDKFQEYNSIELYKVLLGEPINKKNQNKKSVCPTFCSCDEAESNGIKIIAKEKLNDCRLNYKKKNITMEYPDVYMIKAKGLCSLLDVAVKATIEMNVRC